MDMKQFEHDFYKIIHEKPLFSEQFLRDVKKVWGCIAESASGFCEDNESAVEMCIDANRLSTFASAESEQELTNLVTKFGYKSVLTHLTKQVSLN